MRRQWRGCTLIIAGTGKHLLQHTGRQQLKLCTLVVNVNEDHQLAHGHHNLAHGYLNHGAPAAHHSIVHPGAAGKDHLSDEVFASYRAQIRILLDPAHREPVHHHEGHHGGVLPQDQLR